jgi:hypothetical protein
MIKRMPIAAGVDFGKIQRLEITFVKRLPRSITKLWLWELWLWEVWLWEVWLWEVWLWEMRIPLPHHSDQKITIGMINNSVQANSFRHEDLIT